MKPHDFRYRQFLPTIILQCMRWYLRYPLSYRNLEEMMEERGVDVDHTTLYRWVQKYSPELEKSIHGQIYFIHRIFNIYTPTLSKI